MKSLVITFFSYIIPLFFNIKRVKISPELINKLVDEKAQIIDIRLKNEWEMVGVIKGAYKVSFTKPDKKTIRDEFLKELKNCSIDREKPVYLYCRTTNRSLKAVCYLSKNGYKKVIFLGGGITKLIAQGYKPVKE